MIHVLSQLASNGASRFFNLTERGSRCISFSYSSSGHSSQQYSPKIITWCSRIICVLIYCLRTKFLVSFFLKKNQFCKVWLNANNLSSTYYYNLYKRREQESGQNEKKKIDNWLNFWSYPIFETDATNIFGIVCIVAVCMRKKEEVKEKRNDSQIAELALFMAQCLQEFDLYYIH